MRLDKFLSSQLNISRTDAKKALRERRIRVNGKTATSADLHVDPQKDVVSADGRIVNYKEHLYLMLNKPAGVISSSERGVEQKTVIDLLDETVLRPGLFPAGRLDKDTTGFVLITDDGAFAHQILSPAHHVPKTYIVTLQREVREEEKERIEQGMELDGERLLPAELRRLPSGENKYEIVISQGIYHQIKRMFSSFGNEVLALERIRIGGLFLDEKLSPGEYRELTEEELDLIRNA